LKKGRPPFDEQVGRLRGYQAGIGKRLRAALKDLPTGNSLDCATLATGIVTAYGPREPSQEAVQELFSRARMQAAEFRAFASILWPAGDKGS
jgi:hypothetical protein